MHSDEADMISGRQDPNSLLIRVDASIQMGSGHLMRCLALGQAWKDAGGQVIFFTTCTNEGLLRQLRDEKLDIHVLTEQYPAPCDWGYTKDILASYPNAWVVLDGYHFDEVYHQWIKEAGHRLLVIDDMAHLKHYYADIVLNQNLHAEQLHYSCETYTRLLLGTKYVLLRRDFLAWRNWKREIPEVARRVLVTLGGSDPENHTLKVIQALQSVDVPGLEAIAVVGASNPHTDDLEAAIRESRVPIDLIRNATNMPELMAWADVAISGGGTTCLEIAFMSLPSCLISLAENQLGLAEALHEHQICINTGWFRSISPAKLIQVVQNLTQSKELRREMSRRAALLINGQGSQRVTAAILD